MEPSMEDDFKGFGEGFDGFPKHLPEDSVEYYLFIVNSKLKSQKELLARLEAVRKEAMTFSGGLLKDYIWQREAFKLEVRPEKGMIYLHGLTNYGDSVEDEWLIVYILRELSNRFLDLWIKVVDTDGEFLLIEAANALPRWLNPETADNRVWIHQNSLRIIPLTDPPSSEVNNKRLKSKSLKLEEALEILSSRSDSLIHSPLIEAEAFYRLNNYPAQIKTSVHHACITIPRKLAYILHSRPAAIAPATEAFYLRDPISLRLMQSASSKLVFTPEDHVTVSTRFTKVLYAQLKSQQFTPPPVWLGILSKCEKEVASSKVKRETYTQLDMGMKVTSGFEMLISDTQHRDNPTVREIKILLDDLVADADSALPSDEEISQWPDVAREDDEKWLDINFEDFERELQGKSKDQKSSAAPDFPGSDTPPVFFGPEPPPGFRKGQAQASDGMSCGSEITTGFREPSDPGLSTGFGDPQAQAYLRKHVQRFEAMVEGHEGSDLSGEGNEWGSDQSEDSDDGEEDSEGEDKAVSFDEKEFSRMMKEMMGMPADDDGDPARSLEKSAVSEPIGGKIVEETETSDEEGEGVDESQEILDVMHQMEAELKDAGALNLGRAPSEHPSIKGKGKEKEAKEPGEQDSEEDSGDDVNIDFNAARHLLASLQSQVGTGLGGPAANLLNMMGIQSLQDEAESETSNTKK